MAPGARSATPVAMLLHLAAAAGAMRTSVEFFDPIVRFGLAEPPSPPSSTMRPLMLVLPGLDGSGLTAWAQFPELARDYDLRALAIGADDRSSYADLVGTVSDELASAQAAGREVLLFGESMGAGVALDVARGQAAPSAVVLVSPATGWDRTWLGRLRYWLVTLPDPLLGLIVALTTYQLLDASMLVTTARRIVTGEKSPVLDTPARTDYAWSVVRAMPAAFASPPATVRHRIEEWADPSIEAARELSDMRVPTLIVAGTADMRVPAVEEAQRIRDAMKDTCECRVHLVEGAGHAGVTDDRLNLREVLREWRSGKLG